MDPAFLANHLREEIDRAINGKKRAKREAERWANLTDEEKAYEKMMERNAFITLGLTIFIILSIFDYGSFHYTNAFLLIPNAKYLNEPLPEVFTRLAKIYTKEGKEKEAKSYLVSYISMFGSLTAKVFQMQIECVRQKKSITLCQIAINKGELPNLDSINKNLDAQMHAYCDELAEIVKTNKYYKMLETVPEAEYAKIKKIWA